MATSYPDLLAAASFSTAERRPNWHGYVLIERCWRYCCACRQTQVPNSHLTSANETGTLMFSRFCLHYDWSTVWDIGWFYRHQNHHPSNTNVSLMVDQRTGVVWR